MVEIIKFFDILIAAISLSFFLQLIINPLKGNSARQILAVLFFIYFEVFIVAFLFYSKLMPLLFSGLIIWSFNISHYPLYFLYLKSLTTENFRYKRKYLLLFVPFFIYFILFLLIYIKDANEGILLLNAGDPIKKDFLKVFYVVYKSSLYVNLLQFLVYSYFMIFMLKEHNKKIKDYFSYKENISLKWVSILLVVFIIYHSFDNLLDLIGFGAKFDTELRIVVFIVRILYLLFLGIFGVKQINIYKKSYFKKDFTKIETKPEELFEEAVQNENQAEEKEIKDIQKALITLSEGKKQMLMTKIEALMEEQSIYKNPRLSIFDIATELNTNTRYISLVINEIKQMNFNVYINSYRVKEAEQLLKTSDKLRIEDIMYECGFNSKSSFNAIFKKLTGYSPSEFRKKYNN